MTHCFSLLFPRSLHVQYLLCCSLWSGVPMRLAAVLVWTCCKKKKSRPQFFCIYRRGLPWLYNEPGGYVAEMRSAPVTSYMMQWWRWEGVNREEQLYSAVISPNRLSSISQSLPGRVSNCNYGGDELLHNNKKKTSHISGKYTWHRDWVWKKYPFNKPPITLWKSSALQMGPDRYFHRVYFPVCTSNCGMPY